MLLKGKYNTAEVFTDNVEPKAAGQIIELCNQEFAQFCNIKIMPDTHAGAGCVIGTTMTIGTKIVPNLVGVDIGCGMATTKLGDIDIDFEKLDNFIRNNIPSGFKNNEVSQFNYKEELKKLRCIRELPKTVSQFNKALGSLGGGNHFIEINYDKNGCKYLVIHSGSRNLGLQIAKYYQNKAIEYHSGYDDEYQKKRLELIDDYKKSGKKKQIPKALKKLQREHKSKRKIKKELCYLEGQLMNDYLHDMKIAQEYANINRSIMARRICEECLGLSYVKLDKFQTIHNYIDLDMMMLRKGAISAKEGEKVLIPINMRDGSILAIGKGNPAWNYSAPHGAGRIMSRRAAKEKVDLNEYIETMKDVWSTSVKESTLDEAPMVYKPIEEIIENTRDTIEIIDVIKSLYNFKA